MQIRMAIVGACGHVHLALDDLDRLPRVSLVACAPSFPGEDMTRVLMLRDKGHDIAAYDDWRAMLDREQVDLLVTAGRNDTHAAVAMAGAAVGAHIMAEKPAALSLDELAELDAALARAGIHYTMMLPIRYEPPYWTARKLVADGVIGEPLLVSAQKSYRWGASRPDWYGDPALYGSTMAWVGIHAFDFAQWVSGREYRRVFASHANLAHGERQGCQDVATVLAELDNGGSATFGLDYLRPEAASTHGDDRLRVAGAQGVLEVCDCGTRLHVITATQDVRDWPLERTDRTLMTDLVAAIAGEGTLLVDAAQSLSITRFALCAALAADEATPRDL